jgi:hypothetical protein
MTHTWNMRGKKARERKSGAPKRTRKNARSNTSAKEKQLIRIAEENAEYRDTVTRIQRAIEGATAEELDSLSLSSVTTEPPEEERIINIGHVVRRPGDDPTNPQERVIHINTVTRETRIYKRRLNSQDEWQLEPSPR